MKRSLWFSAGVFVLAVVLGFSTYRFFARPAPTFLHQTVGELAWLRDEFHLTPEQYEKVRRLHEAYTPICAAMCERVTASNEQLETLIGKNRALTPELQDAFRQTATLRQECQQAMLRHLYQVSQNMSTADGARFLDLVKDRVVQPGGAHCCPVPPAP